MLPLPKNRTPALALRPPPYDLQLPHINSWMKPELLEHSDVVYSRVLRAPVSVESVGLHDCVYESAVAACS